MEAELKELSEEESLEYLQSLGADEGGLSSLIAATYTQLGLRTYFTVGPKVCCSSCIRVLLGASMRHLALHRCHLHSARSQDVLHRRPQGLLPPLHSGA